MAKKNKHWILADFLAHEKHFLDHLVPMYHSTPDEFRGDFILPNYLEKYARTVHGIEDVVTYHGNRAQARIHMSKDRRRLVVCSASGDQIQVARAGRYAIFTQHGAGQSFTRIQSSYAGYPGRKNIAALIFPGNHPANRDRPLYPEAEVFVVGCPKLDPWHSGELDPPKNNIPVVVFSSHWDCKVVPETRSAFWHMLPGLDELAKKSGKDFILYGHGHPRALKHWTPEYRKRKVPVIGNFSEVMRRADLYIMDHMSTLYEFASAGEGGNGRPVVVMNCPHYRKGVEHGLRYWSAADVGIQVDKPGDLYSAVIEALADKPERQKKRREAVEQVFKFTDGKSSDRAGDAIRKTVERFRKKNATSIYIPEKRKMIRGKVMEQFQLIARVRLQNSNRGFTPRGNSVVSGINAKPGRTFWTDASHKRDLLKLQYAREPEADEIIPFPGKGDHEGQVETLDESKIPEFEAIHRGGGYYDICEDGVVVDQIRGAGTADERVETLKKEWIEKNVNV